MIYLVFSVLVEGTLIFPVLGSVILGVFSELSRLNIDFPFLLLLPTKG